MEQRKMNNYGRIISEKCHQRRKLFKPMFVFTTGGGRSVQWIKAKIFKLSLFRM